MTKPLVSVIISARNEEEVIGRLLKSIKRQAYKNIEVIVVDDNSTDRTYAISRRFTPLVFSKKARTERSSSRNLGVRNSKGKYLLVLDADMELTPGVVSACVDIMKKEKKIGGIVVPEVSVANTFWEKVKAHERSFYSLEGDMDIEAARFFSRRAFNEIGGYDETVTGPEDWLLPETMLKLGYKITRVNNSFLYHHERIPTLISLAKKKFYYAKKTGSYLAKIGVSPISNKTVYFLRGVFYRNWRHLFKKPLLSIAMVWMFLIELLAGGIGYLYGFVKK